VLEFRHKWKAPEQIFDQDQQALYEALELAADMLEAAESILQPIPKKNINPAQYMDIVDSIWFAADGLSDRLKPLPKPK
jgi:hypothetical protein